MAIEENEQHQNDDDNTTTPNVDECRVHQGEVRRDGDDPTFPRLVTRIDRANKEGNEKKACCSQRQCFFCKAASKNQRIQNASDNDEDNFVTVGADDFAGANATAFATERKRKRDMCYHLLKHATKTTKKGVQHVTATAKETGGALYNASTTTGWDLLAAIVEVTVGGSCS